MLKAIIVVYIGILHISSIWCQPTRVELHSPRCHGSADGTISVYFAAQQSTNVFRLMEASNNRLLQSKNITTDTLVEFTKLRGGRYIVQTVIKGEPAEYPINLEEPAKLDAQYIEITDVHERGESVKADLKLICSGGQAPYSVRWTENAGNQTGEMIKDLELGIYTCYLTDSNNCGPVSATFFLFEDEIEKFNQTKESTYEN